MYLGNFVFAITVNCLYSCFFCFRTLSTQQGGYARATNLFIIIINHYWDLHHAQNN